MTLNRFFSLAFAGCLIVGALTFFAVNEKADFIEKDLKSRAEKKLSIYSDWLEINIEGRNITLSGVAPTKDIYNEVIKKADGGFLNRQEGTWGVRVVKPKDLTLLPLEKPYDISLKLNERTIHIEGFLPSEKFETRFLESLTKSHPNIKIENNTRLARGASKALKDRMQFSLKVLQHLQQGEVRLIGDDFFLSGDVLNNKKKETIENEIGLELPYGLNRGLIELNVLIKAPVAVSNELEGLLDNSLNPGAPQIETSLTEKKLKKTQGSTSSQSAFNSYVFTAIKNNGVLMLSGKLPSAKLKNDLNEKAKSLNFKEIEDTTRINEKAPKGFDNVSRYALKVISNFAEGSVLIADEKIMIDGSLIDLKAHEEIKKLMTTVPDGFVLEGFSFDNPIVDNYFFSVDVQTNILKISGLVSDMLTFDKASKKADEFFSEQPYTTSINLAEGIPKDVHWLQAIEFSYLVASKIAQGKVDLKNNVLSVEGFAKSFESFASLNNMIESHLPAKIETATIDIRPPVMNPYHFKAEFIANSLKLSGHLPNLPLKEEMINFSKRRFGEILEFEDLVWASGAPDRYNIAVKTGLQGLSRLSEGQLIVEDMLVELSGVASFGAPINEIRENFLGNLPPDYTGEADIFPGQRPEEKEPDICSAIVQEHISNNRIYFNIGRATILSDSFGLLDRLAETILSCPDARFEISGHTDASGSAASNMRLSQSRAQTVADYLKRAGVHEDNFEAIGYGETRPIAKNNTKEAKALNRRIEFKLLKAE